MKTLILLVEGATEEIVYSMVLEKLYGANSRKLEELPETLREFIEPIKKPVKCYELRHGVFVCLINCGGFSQIKSVLKQMLHPKHISRVIRGNSKLFKSLNLRIVITADRDLRPTESVKGLLASLELSVSEGRVLKVKLVENVELPIFIIEQGGSGDTATGEIEDLLRKLIEVLKPELRDIINNFERICGCKLTDKQRFLIYLTLLDNKPKIRSLYDTLREKVLKQVGKDQVRQALQNLLTVLEEAFS